MDDLLLCDFSEHWQEEMNLACDAMLTSEIHADLLFNNPLTSSASCPSLTTLEKKQQQQRKKKQPKTLRKQGIVSRNNKRSASSSALAALNDPKRKPTPPPPLQTSRHKSGTTTQRHSATPLLPTHTSSGIEQYADPFGEDYFPPMSFDASFQYSSSSSMNNNSKTLDLLLAEEPLHDSHFQTTTDTGQNDDELFSSSAPPSFHHNFDASFESLHRSVNICDVDSTTSSSTNVFSSSVPTISNRNPRDFCTSASALNNSLKYPNDYLSPNGARHPYDRQKSKKRAITKCDENKSTAEVQEVGKLRAKRKDSTDTLARQNEIDAMQSSSHILSHDFVSPCINESKDEVNIDRSIQKEKNNHYVTAAVDIPKKKINALSSKLMDALGSQEDENLFEKGDESSSSKQDIFSAENSKETAGSLWLLLHAWKCKEKCEIKYCDVMQRVLKHCLSCELAVGKCEEVCNKAKKMLLHYRKCGRINEIKRLDCLVCSKLMDIDASQNQKKVENPNSKSTLSKSGSATLCSNSTAKPIGQRQRPIQPNPISTTGSDGKSISPNLMNSMPMGLAMEMKKKIDDRVQELAGKDLLKHMQKKTRLRSLDDLRVEARVQVMKEYTATGSPTWFHSPPAMPGMFGFPMYPGANGFMYSPHTLVSPFSPMFMPAAMPPTPPMAFSNNLSPSIPNFLLSKPNETKKRDMGKST